MTQFLLAQLSGAMLVVAGAAVFWRGKARTLPSAPVELAVVEPEVVEAEVVEAEVVEAEVVEVRSWGGTCTTSGPGARRHRRIIARKPPSRAPHRS